MQVSGLILLIFVNYALQQSTHDIQKFICTADVEIDEDRNTVFKLRNTGASCQYVPLVVDRNGFKFDIVFPSDVAHEELEFLDLLFENSTARVSLYFKKPYDETEIYGGGRILTTSYSSTATIKVSAGGTGYIYHGNAADIILFPSLTDLPTVATDKAVLKMKFIWRNLINGLNVRFPPEIGFLYATTTTTMIDVLTQDVSAPATSPGYTATSTVGPTNGVAASTDPTPETAEEEQHEYKHMWLIIVLSVLAIIGIIGDIVVFVVIGIILYRRFRSAQTKPATRQVQSTPRRLHANVLSSGTRQKTSGGEYEFPPPKKASSRMKDRSISFNGYLAVVPAYKHEVVLFERANAADRERMYQSFLQRIRVEEGRGSNERR